MRLELTGRHVTITPAVRKLVEQRLQHILRFLNDNAVSAQVVLTREKTRYHADVTLHARGEHFLHGESTGRDVATALAAAADKIDRQALKLKEKWKDKRRGVAAGRGAVAAPRPELGGPPATGRPGKGSPVAAKGNSGQARSSGLRVEPEGPQARVIRARRYSVKPMSIDEAALEVNEGGEAFLVFRNASTDTISILFRRPDGNLGLIEPEA